MATVPDPSLILPVKLTLSIALNVKAPLVELILPELPRVTSPDVVVLKLIAPLPLVSVFPMVNPVEPSRVNAPVVVVKLPLLVSAPPLLLKVSAPVPVEKLKDGKVKVPLEITLKG